MLNFHNNASPAESGRRIAPERGAKGIIKTMVLNAVIVRDLVTGLLVGSVPGIPGAHTQGETVEEVRANLAEVLQLLQEQGAITPESEFVATIPVAV